MQDEWLTNRLAYLKGLKSPNDQQRLLILLTEKSEQSKEDSRKINALVSAEKAASAAPGRPLDSVRTTDMPKANLCTFASNTQTAPATENPSRYMRDCRLKQISF